MLVLGGRDYIISWYGCMFTPLKLLATPPGYPAPTRGCADIPLWLPPRHPPSQRPRPSWTEKGWDHQHHSATEAHLPGVTSKPCHPDIQTKITASYGFVHPPMTRSKIMWYWSIPTYTKYVYRHMTLPYRIKSHVSIYILVCIYIINYVKPPHVSVVYTYSTYLNHYTHIIYNIYGRFCVYTLSLTFASRRATRASETERQPRATQKRTHSWRVKRMKRWSHCSQCLGKIRENYGENNNKYKKVTS